jgi:hypothetical protein
MCVVPLGVTASVKKPPRRQAARKCMLQAQQIKAENLAGIRCECSIQAQREVGRFNIFKI